MPSASGLVLVGEVPQADQRGHRGDEVRARVLARQPGERVEAEFGLDLAHGRRVPSLTSQSATCLGSNSGCAASPPAGAGKSR